MKQMIPNKITYPGQPEGEITQRVVYKSIMTIGPILAAMVLVLLGCIVAVIAYNKNSAQINAIIPNGFISVLGFLLIGSVVFLLLGTVWIWRRNKIIITNSHVVDMDQIGLFNMSLSTLSLYEIQDIKSTIKGPIQTFLNYGTVVIQTAGETENFVFDFIADPNELKQYILSARKIFYSSKAVHKSTNTIV